MHRPTPPAQAILEIERLLGGRGAHTEPALAAVCERLGHDLEVDAVWIDRVYGGATRVETIARWGARASGAKDAKGAVLEGAADLAHYAEGPPGLYPLDSRPIVRDGVLGGFVHAAVRHPGIVWKDAQSRLLGDVAGLLAGRLGERSEERAHGPTAGEVGESAESTGPDDRPAILIVEDDPVNANVLERIVTRKGGLAEIATSGRTAIEACRRRRFALIMMDLRMPGLDGFDATREIVTGDSPNAGTPIVAITADTTKGVERRCMKLGMRQYIPKPIRSEIIGEVIAKFTGPR